jgi:hypothetical protein
MWARRSTNDKPGLKLSVFLILLSLFCTSCSDLLKSHEMTESDKQTGIRLTLEWGRLAPFPKAAREFVITTHGNMFTRSFRISFSAPKEDVARWMEESPGLRDTEPKKEASQRKYVIKPGGGAVYAEVVIDDATDQVRTYVAWS